ncbi:MAG TPA: phage tail tip lysozyme, partial [Polyangia bacterium]|nr:phage tail tip lysozyme [Polyangia bacterium]
MFGLAMATAGCVQTAAPSADELRLTTDESPRATPKTAFKNDQTAYDYFRAQGFTNFQAAGITGNLDQESGIDPTISQSGGGPGRGIAQWSAGGRWDTDAGDNCVAFAAMNNESPDDLSTQLDFIMFELDNFSDYGLAKLKASTNVTDATTDFELGFEGCDIADECDGDSRISYAMSVLAAYGNDPVATPDGGSSGSTDMAQAGGNGGGGGSAGGGGSSAGGTGTAGGTGAAGGSGSAGGGSEPVKAHGCSVVPGAAAGSSAATTLLALAFVL